MKPRLLDLFCGAGGAAMGYHRAGFEVVGVDIKPQPRYPFEFIRADALAFVAANGHEFDAIHASPPCQAYSVARSLHKRNHPKLIEPLRELLIKAGRPFVIENVPGAPLTGIVLCGTSFGLNVEYKGENYELRRHRIFESNLNLTTKACAHALPVIGVYGHGESKSMRGKRGFQISVVAVRRAVMDMAWANRDEIAEAIPPAYTEFIGKQLIEVIK